MNLLELATAYQRSAVVAAACASGVADAIAGRPRPPEAVAGACGTDPRATRALLGAMVALGLADHGPGGDALSAGGAALASGHPASVAGIVAKEWFFYQAWAGLPASVRDGHARLPPWRERLATDPGRSLDFLRALDDLAAGFADELAALAGERWDAVLLANVLHDHPPDRCQATLATAAALLAPGGTLLVYEWVLDEDGGGPAAVALFDLMMLVENEGGGAWTASQLTAWLQAAGLTGVELRRGSGPLAVLTSRAPRP